MKAKDLREKSVEDLRDLEKSLATDAFQAKLKNFTNRLDDTSQIKKVRRDLARVKTLLAELARPKAKPDGTASAEPAAAAKKAPAKKTAVKKTKTPKTEANP